MSNSLLALSKLDKSLSDAACPDWLIWSPIADGLHFSLRPDLWTQLKELKHAKKWLDANKLALNVENTNFIVFHSPQNSLDENINIKVGKGHVKQAKFVKFLGLLLD